MKIQKKYLSDTDYKYFQDNIFEGTECCPYCDLETDFVVTLTKNIYIKCNNCGKEILPCSLCNSSKYCGTGECDEVLAKSLIEYRDNY